MRERPDLNALRTINSLNYSDGEGFDREELLTSYKYNKMIARAWGIEHDRLQQTIAPLKKLVDTANKPKILDIGCGEGMALKIAENMGFECYGVEFSDEAVKHLHYQVFTSLNEIENSGTLFDVVLLSAVIEHLPDPKETLIKSRSLLKDNGILVVFTDNERSLFKVLGRSLNKFMFLIEKTVNLRPNIKDNKMELFYQQRRYKKGIEYLEPAVKDIKGLNEFAAANLQHIYLFEPPTLKKLLKAAGYEIVHYPTGYMFKPISRNRKIIQNQIINKIAKHFGMQMNIVYYCKKSPNKV